MGKEMTPIEAVKRIEDDIEIGYLHIENAKDKQNYLGLLNTIESALKKLENYEQNEDFSKDVLNYAFLNEQDKIKKIKALEIIKETLGIELHFVDKTQKYCIFIGGLVAYELKGKEEYDLLKEVLL